MVTEMSRARILHGAWLLSHAIDWKNISKSYLQLGISNHSFDVNTGLLTERLLWIPSDNLVVEEELKVFMEASVACLFNL